MLWHVLALDVEDVEEDLAVLRPDVLHLLQQTLCRCTRENPRNAIYPEEKSANSETEQTERKTNNFRGHFAQATYYNQGD